MSNPIMSIICGGNRPHSWSALIDALKVQQTPYEIVMVGPNPPVAWVPEYFHYHYSNVKPHQAQVAAAVLAQGRLLCYFNDDWVIKQPNALGQLVDEWDKCGDEEAIVAPHMSNSYPYLSFATDKAGPILPFGDVFSRENFLKRGGWDTRFIGIYASNDRAIEMQQKGKPVKICYNIVLDEVSVGSLWDELWQHDRSYLAWLWMEGYELTTPRERDFDVPLRPIRKVRRVASTPYDLTRDDLLYVHQGPKGKWRDSCKNCWELHKICDHVPPPAVDPDIATALAMA